MGELTLIRHGKTKWTEEKRFSGWGNAPLGSTGRDEACSASKALKDANQKFDICFTSRLLRAQDTAEIICDELGMSPDKLHYRWHLNERHYGSLQNNLRSDMRQEHGAASVLKWRNSYHAKPPELKDSDPRWLEQLKRFKDIPQAEQPRGESMAEAVKRTELLWHKEIGPAIQSGKKVLVVAHTNSIRSLVRSIEGLDDVQSAGFRMTTATPRHYELDDTLKALASYDLTNSLKAKAHYWVIRKKMDIAKTLAFTKS